MAGPGRSNQQIADLKQQSAISLARVNPVPCRLVEAVNLNTNID